MENFMEVEYEELINLAGFDGHSITNQYNASAKHEDWYQVHTLRYLSGRYLPTPSPLYESPYRLCFRYGLFSPTT